MSRSRSPFVALAGVLAAGAVLLAQIGRYGLLGFDTYPIILTSRVRSWSDLVGNFTERLMDGRYPGAFYRPVLDLTFAADYALWKLAPWGYHLADVALFCAAALLVWALVRRLAGAGSWVAPLTALAAFLLHPTHFEVLPAPSRRPELLCCAFMLLALVLQLAPRALERSRPALGPAVATLAAIASKESGFILPPLVGIAVLVCSERPTWRGRARHAAAAFLPPLVAAVLMLAARIAVLGGLGGHGELAAEEVARGASAYVFSIAAGLLLPQPVMLASPAAVWLLVVLGLGLVASRVAAGGRIALPLAWIGLFGLTYAAAGRIGSWYFLLPVAGWSMLIGLLAAGLVRRSREGDRLGRLVALPTLALLGSLLAWQARYSPLVHHYDEWERATAASREFLEETSRRIAGAAPGTVVEAPPLPMWVQPRSDGPTIFGAAILTDYSIEAWADLVYPERKVVVRYARGQLPPPAADGLVVLITRRKAGY